VGKDFSTTNNPNGVWSYGSETTLGGALTLFTSIVDNNGVEIWNNPSLQDGAGYNGTASAAASCPSCSIPAGDAMLGPGSDLSYSLFRFTAPVAGAFDIEASFFGADFQGPTTTDVHVVLNGVPLFSDAVNGYGPTSTKSYSGIQTLAIGDTVDFVVGPGADNNFSFDTTGLTATISSAPEPATLGLMCVSLLVLWKLRRREFPAGD
jgi:hypothetical protein